MIYIQSTRRTAPDLCKNVSLPVLFGNDGTSYTVSTQSGMYIYTYSSQYREAGRAKGIKKILDSSEFSVPKESYRVPLWARKP